VGARLSHGKPQVEGLRLRPLNILLAPGPHRGNQDGGQGLLQLSTADRTPALSRALSVGS
jgi:hypothetical protein